jgi:molybdenum cofactor biosynthesis protein B
MSAARHRRQAAAVGGLPLAVVTVSDTRTPETDASGPTIRRLAEAAGHRVIDQRIVPDEVTAVRAALAELLGGGARVILFNGGTGISRRDRTYDVVSAALEKPLPGFGELFRLLSFHEIGAAAMLSRAVAGIIGDVVVFSLPGSPDAVRLAMERLILPELAHLVWELER